MWRQNALELLEGIFEASLIPLTKVWPAIAQSDQFSLIIALSVAFKWLEVRFIPRLHDYLCSGLDGHQTIFLPCMGTTLNIELLRRELTGSLKRDALAAYL